MPNLAKRFTFYTKYLNLSSKCSKFRFKTFQNKNKIKFKYLNFDIFKGFLILIEFDKLGRKIRQIRPICLLSLSFKKTQLPYTHVIKNNVQSRKLRNFESNNVHVFAENNCNVT